MQTLYSLLCKYTALLLQEKQRTLHACCYTQFLLLKTISVGTKGWQNKFQMPANFLLIRMIYSL